MKTIKVKVTDKSGKVMETAKVNLDLDAPHYFESSFEAMTDTFGIAMFNINAHDFSFVTGGIIKVNNEFAGSFNPKTKAYSVTV